MLVLSKYDFFYEYNLFLSPQTLISTKTLYKLELIINLHLKDVGVVFE